jgi:hypothetical protein
MRVTMEAVATASPRSEQHHTDTTAANADRWTVVTTGLILLGQYTLTAVLGRRRPKLGGWGVPGP